MRLNKYGTPRNSKNEFREIVKTLDNYTDEIRLKMLLKMREVCKYQMNLINREIKKISDNDKKYCIKKIG